MSHNRWSLYLLFRDVIIVGLIVFVGGVSAEQVRAQTNLRLLLPPVLYAAPGIELNVYFDNVVLTVNPAIYAFDVSCRRGVQQAERWTYTPRPEDVGETPFVLEVRDGDNRTVARGESIVRVVAANAGAGRDIRALLIGDSLTAASVYSQQLLDNCREEGNPALKLIGTRGPDNARGLNRHEGYGGWTALRFATHFTGKARGGEAKECGSPFIYADAGGQPRLDFARYCAEFNAGKGPDFVTILLGCNDTFSSDDETIEARIETMFKYYDTLVAMVRGVSGDTRIGAILPVPPAASQDAFGASYQSNQTRWQYKRNQHRVMERMVERYGGREAENLFLVPAYVNLDCVHNYPDLEAAWNSRAAAKGRRLNNGVHPAPEGYRQIGDSVYCWLKAMLAGNAGAAR